MLETLRVTSPVGFDTIAKFALSPPKTRLAVFPEEAITLFSAIVVTLCSPEKNAPPTVEPSDSLRVGVGESGS